MEQTRWLEALNRTGYRAELCKGWAAAAEVIEAYLKNGGKGEKREFVQNVPICGQVR